MQVVQTAVRIGELTLTIEHPPDPVELIDEAAFEQEEFLPYWAELWPSAVALGRRVATLDPAGRSVLELGCGLGLPSIVAARGGARVLATDWSADALVFAERNADLNDVELETRLVTWAEPGELAGDRWSLVLCADVLYERRNVEQLLALLPRLGKHALLADPGRPALRAFLDGAAAGAWAVERHEVEELPRGGIHSLRRR